MRRELAHAPVLQMSKEEASCRVDVAMCYRLISLYGMSDFTDGFVSARIDGSPSDIIVGGYGLLPEQARASALLRRNLHSALAIEKHGGVDVDAMCFTRAVLDARPDVAACIHAHPPYSTIFASLDCDLLPMSQYGFMYHGKLGYVPFGTQDVTSQETTDLIAAALANGKEAVVLRNHGLIVPGKSVSHAFWLLYRLEQTFRIQIEAMKTGAKIVTPPPEQVRIVQQGYWSESYIDNDGSREWQAFARKLDRLDPSFRD